MTAIKPEIRPAASTRWPAVALGLVVLAGAGALWGNGLFAGGKADPLARFLLSAAVILLVCHLFGWILRRFGQPPVLGEVIGGLLLGPSALGLVWPSAQDWLFTPAVLAGLSQAAQLGLITFMFLLGCELRLDRLTSRRVVAATVVGGMGLPFLAGVAIAVPAASMLAAPSADRTTYVLFFGLALAITALPVLARVLVDLGMDRTRLGATALSCAAIGDGVAWLVLTVILAASGLGGNGNPVATAGLAVALIVVTFLLVRPALALLVRRVRSPQVLLGCLAVGAIGFAGLTQQIGLHPVIGAFLFGVSVPRGAPIIAEIGEQLQGFALAILLPLFFAGVGISTSAGLLGDNPMAWLLFAGVLAVAIGAKYLGAGGSARLAGLPKHEARQLGTLMNCRGVTELVVATIGLQYGLLSELGFTIVVLVAVITTAMSGPIMRRLNRAPVQAGA
uniref:PyrJ1 n=1 Tax=Streptomyces rugosporus TaxID=295838 RepID=K7QSJ4_STRRG|nr:PyrJ1 [Streptomyces rugosporus]